MKYLFLCLVPTMHKKRILLKNIKKCWNCQSHQTRRNKKTKYPASYIQNIQYSISSSSVKRKNFKTLKVQLYMIFRNSAPYVFDT